jgi:CRISPR/Cas system endoribonuclease Cas6 (RAMP superfamily)
MAQYQTKIILTLKSEGLTFLAGEVLDITDERAADINEQLESAFPTLSPVLIPLDKTPDDKTPTNDPDDNTPDDKAPTREELKAELKALGVEYPSRATIAQLTELLEAAKK